MPRHHVLTRLARHFHVVWCDSPREWRPWVHRDIAPALDPTVPDIPGFHLYRPGRLHPLLYRPAFAARWTAAGRLARARSLLARRGVRKFILYLWRPVFADHVDLVAHDLSCYHIDDDYAFSVQEQPLDPREVGLMRRVDQVFIHSPALMARKGSINAHTEMVPNGVDYQSFAAPVAEPSDLAGIPHPRVGYVGVLKEQVDWELMEALARKRPEWSLVFVGPSRLTGRDAECWSRLLRLPNVHALGGKAGRAVPGYVHHLDVCLLSYRVNDYTKYIYPLKLHEYLATGRPVVGSSLPSLVPFRGTITLASSIDEWEVGIADAIARTGDEPARAARQRVAADHDWNVLVDRVAATLGRRLNEVAR